MKLKEWAREQGVSYRAALNWFHAGTLPAPARQLNTGTILVESPTSQNRQVVAYCCVASTDRRADLERQAGRVAAACGERGISLDRTVTETESERDGDRPRLHALLADPQVGTLVVEHRDRLAHCGVAYLESALAAAGRRLIALYANEVPED